MEFWLIRHAMVNYGAKVATWAGTSHTDEQIGIQSCDTTQSSNGKSTHLLMASRIVDQFPCSDKKITIPDDLRRGLELVLETHVDAVAVLNQCSRSIASPLPYIAIEPLDTESVEWLSDKLISIEIPSAPIRMWHDFDFSGSMPHLEDRFDGVALIAESLGHNHPTGRLHELMRFFERAFALSAGRITRNELPSFLAHNQLGYTQTETEHWIELRDTTSHADRRPYFALQADTAPVVNRIEQAAYDVLFNKLNWRDGSLDRRDVFRPHVGSNGNSSSIFATQGLPATITVSVRDGFDTYPLDTNSGLNSLPDNWLTDTAAKNDPDLSTVAG